MTDLTPDAARAILDAAGVPEETFLSTPAGVLESDPAGIRVYPLDVDSAVVVFGDRVEIETEYPARYGIASPNTTRDVRTADDLRAVIATADEIRRIDALRTLAEISDTR